MFKNIVFFFTLLSIGLAINVINDIEEKVDICPNPEDFHCSTGNVCINSELECDGKNDCPDGSDEIETECDFKLCKPPNYYMCNDNETCITDDSRCDTYFDCPADDDEENCADYISQIECKLHEFACLANTMCIGMEYVCDGIQQCIDGSDEFNCVSNCTFVNNKFLCGDNVTCLPIEKLCNNEVDCNDGSDEGEICSKFNNNSPCAIHYCPDNAECFIRLTGPVCVCPKGFSYNNVTNVCEDIDECQMYGICSQGCVNTQGSYYCTCAKRFRLKNDNSSCEIESETGSTDPILLYAAKKSINMVHLRSGNQTIVIDKMVRQVIGLSSDGYYVYWTNVALNTESIVKARMDGTNIETLLMNGLSLPEDLAIDWITGNLYFSDAMYMHIAVCSHDGKNCNVLITENVERPRGIALYPQEGRFYWSEWGSKPMIAVAHMDGESARPFIRDNIQWPSGITLDWPNDRLYWVDAKLHQIESCKLDGTGRQTVIGTLQHPYGLAVFENNIYWSDWETMSVETCNKFTGNDRKIIVENLKVYDLHIYHRSVQPITKNPCKNTNCTHLCMLAPNETFSCGCPVGMTLDIDRVSCITTTKMESIFIGVRNNFIKMEHTIFGRHQIEKAKVLPVYIHKMAFNSLNGHVFIANNIAKIICDYDSINGKVVDLVTKSIGMVSSMSFDHLSNNLYWSDSERGTIEVLSLNTKHRTIVRRYTDSEKPIAMAVIPENGEMFVASRNSSGQTQITIQSMHGNGDQHLIIESQRGDIQFDVDKGFHEVYFCDSENKRIGWTDYRGQSMNIFKSNISNGPTSVAVLSDDVFWTKKNSHNLFFTPKVFPDMTRELVLPRNENVSQADDIVIVAAFPTSFVSHHPCMMTDNGGCSHICATLNATHSTCLCPPGAHNENNTCTETEYVDCELRCDSGECITASQQCNNVNDCSDASDERDCASTEMDQVNCHQDEFKCLDGKQCVAMSRRCDKTNDCNDKSDEADCVGYKNPTTKCNENQFSCSSDRCIDIKTVCEVWFEQMKNSRSKGV